MGISLPVDLLSVDGRRRPHSQHRRDTSLQMVKLKENASILHSLELNSQLFWEPIA